MAGQLEPLQYWQSEHGREIGEDIVRRPGSTRARTSRADDRHGDNTKYEHQRGARCKRRHHPPRGKVMSEVQGRHHERGECHEAGGESDSGTPSLQPKLGGGEPHRDGAPG